MILNIGSLNEDWVYEVPEIVRPGETLPAVARQFHAGGKGLNQSLALARAGASVRHVGAVGPNGKALIEVLRDSGVDVSGIRTRAEPSGHAIIQKDRAGENAIVLWSGANRTLEISQIQESIGALAPESWVLTQNETNGVAEILTIAKTAGMRVAWNPAPFMTECRDYPLDHVDCLIVNEREGQGFSGATEPREILRILNERMPRALLVLTLGENGSLASVAGEVIFEPAAKVPKVVDTTAAGDTFTGYFLSALMRGNAVTEALRQATQAAAICVQRAGAAPSIPWMRDGLFL